MSPHATTVYGEACSWTLIENVPVVRSASGCSTVVLDRPLARFDSQSTIVARRSLKPVMPAYSAQVTLWVCAFWLSPGNFDGGLISITTSNVPSSRSRSVAVPVWPDAFCSLSLIVIGVALDAERVVPAVEAGGVSVVVVST